VQAHGPGVTRNFPGEVISELPVAVGEDRKQRSSSRFIGVSWHKAKSSWKVPVWDPQSKEKRCIGYYASEDDAARAYECATVKMHRPGAKRNFPGEATSELPVTVSIGEERKQRNSPQYIDVAWDKASSSFHVQMWNPENKCKLHIGCYSSEGAARAYDCAAVQARGPGANRNFPGEAIGEQPGTV
jgi:hypothetical protein